MSQETDGDDLGTYQLRLYVTGNTARSVRAIQSIRTFCDQHLSGQYRLEIIDIHQQPEMARQEQLIAAPTLIKRSPLPLRRLVGDMSQSGRVMAGLGLSGRG